MKRHPCVKSSANPQSVKEAMTLPFFYELLGYAASILVAISLMMKSVLRLRIINLVGALCFTIYGLVIQAYPVAFMNALIMGINVYYLAQMARAKAYFHLFETDADSDYLQEFLKFYTTDIQQFFPGFKLAAAGQMYFILRDLVPVGLFIVEHDPARGLVARLDYVIPGYRDLQPGRFVYEELAGIFKGQGVARIYAQAGTKAHQAYLERMGFKLEGEWYWRNLGA
jgi:hypothetical protein